jgi:lysozyme
MDGTFDGILDIYHDDDIPLSQAQSEGIVAVIHKASEGATYQDPMYTRRRYEAQSLGLLWGAYHFSSGKPPQDQVDNFLESIQWGVDAVTDAQTVLCLDFENSHSGANMTIDDACTFVTLVHGRTGRWPMVYGSNLVTDADAHAPLACALSNCPVWYASYNDQPKNPPHRLWTAISLWQYTDGGADGPAPRLGKLDRDCYIGTQAELQQAWPNFALA